MTLYDFISANRDLSLRLTSAGILKSKVDTYYSIYARYKHYISRGMSKTSSIKTASNDHFTCEQTGWAAVRVMENEI